MKFKVKLFLLIILTALFLDSQLFATTIDKQLLIQPILITDGTNAFFNIDDTAFNGYETVLDSIWEQAGIDIEFFSLTKYANGGYGSIEYSELAGTDLQYPPYTHTGGEFWTDAESDSSASSVANIINIWFTRVVYSYPDIAGYTKPSYDGGDGAVIFKEAALGNVAGVIGHELGHVLGLEHSNIEANLMYLYTNDGTSLTSSQIETARRSGFLIDYYSAVPEPATMLLFGIGLLSLAGVSRRKK